jgi:hypothetical protein
MSTFGCVKCGKPVQMPQGNLEPGSQWLLNCPHCGYGNWMGVGYPAQQGFQTLVGNQQIGRNGFIWNRSAD